MDYKNDHVVDIRSAVCQIADLAGFLRNVRAIAEKNHVHIICFNAEMVAGQRHVLAAVRHAIRAYNEGSMISNTLEMESLLYAAGSRQCNIASSFGIRTGENHLQVCCYPVCRDIWEELIPLLHCTEELLWEEIPPGKQKRLMDLFSISPEELKTLSKNRSIVDLVLERVTLLDAIK